MEDEDLARAITLSLQDHAAHDVIDLQSDSEDSEEVEFQRQLQQALEASKAEAPRPTSATTASSKTSQGNDQGSSTIASAPLDWRAERAQLEKERLARQARLLGQQQTSGSTTGTRRNSPEDSSDTEEDERPAKRQNIGKTASTPASTNAQPSEQLFLDGEFRQTANQFAHPRADGKLTFRLSDILGNKEDISFAIISSYSLDISWTYALFDRDTPVILVAQPEGANSSVRNVLPNWIKTTPFLPGGRGCQHMKFLLLFYKTGRLRVVISTANLVPYDWRDIENTVWLQDIPKRQTAGPNQGPPDDFPGMLQYMLYGVNVAPALKIMISTNPRLPIKSIDEIRQGWDFSRVKAHLVPSIVGKHEGWPSVIKAGHPRLMIAVRKMGLRTMKGAKAKTLTLECQGSSLGNYTTLWLNEFHWSARGESAEDWLDAKKKDREKQPLPPIKIIYPTLKTVQDSALGELGGGTIFCRKAQWEAKNFPRSLFHDSRSKGGPVLMHSKMIIGLLRDHQFTSPKNANWKGKHRAAADTDSEDEDEIQIIDQHAGWAYIGSHNFTPSAWGTLSGSSFNPVLNISNYEVGVVFPLKDEPEADRISCFQRPPKKYGSSDLPWMQGESRVLQQVSPQD